jgi:hypothetical protein
VVQPANHRKLDHPPNLRRLHGSRLRGVLAKGQMSAARVIVLGDESPVGHHDARPKPDAEADEVFTMDNMSR